MNIFSKGCAVGALLLLGSVGLSACASSVDGVSKVVNEVSIEKTSEPLEVTVESDIVQTNDTLVDLDEIPDWALETFDSIPAGEWSYRGDDSQLRAVSKSFNAEALVNYVDVLKERGWLTAQGAPSGGYALVSSDGSEHLEIQRTTTLDEQGEAHPATAVTLTRNH